MEWRRGWGRKAALLVFAWISLVSVVCPLIVSSCSATARLDIRSSMTDSYYTQGSEQQRGRHRTLSENGGPGSYPPLCTAKCGGCMPCVPVHVPIPPGTPVTAEYYPEAWLCKCGGKLYKP